MEQGKPPMGGSGQGNGDGPCIYTAEVDKADKVVELWGAGTLVVAPMTRNLVNLPNIKYVDYNQGLTSSTCLLDKGEVVIPRAQKELNDWQQLAAVS